MALINIRKIAKLEKQRNTIHQEVDATYTFFEKNGEVYFQIDTYGTKNRVCADKISQSIQMDMNSATEFVKLITKEIKYNLVLGENKVSLLKNY